MNSRFGLIVRLGIFLAAGAVAVLLDLAWGRLSSIPELVVRVALPLVVALIVVAIVDLNGSRLRRSVSRLRSPQNIFEIDRIDGNESDARVLGMVGRGLNSRFVVVVGVDGLEVWTDEQDRDPALTAPWSSLVDVSIVTIPSAVALFRASIDAVELQFTTERDIVRLDLAPHRRFGRSSKASGLTRLADAVAARVNATRS